MMYIKHDGQKITGVFSGASVPDGAVEVPASFVGGTGTAIAQYDDAWNIRPMEDLIADGLVTPPDGFVWDGGDWKIATDRELVDAGRRVLADTEVLDGDFIREKTTQELLDACLIADDDPMYIDFKRRQALARLAAIDFESARPLRAILAGEDTEYDRQKVKELEKEARKLRSSLSES